MAIEKDTPRIITFSTPHEELAFRRLCFAVTRLTQIDGGKYGAVYQDSSGERLDIYPTLHNPAYGLRQGVIKAIYSLGKDYIAFDPEKNTPIVEALQEKDP